MKVLMTRRELEDVEEGIRRIRRIANLQIAAHSIRLRRGSVRQSDVTHQGHWASENPLRTVRPS
jgi:hypothetical protein